MTDKEAIYILQGIHRINRKMDEAVDMAIKTLEQKPCEDCISRQAVDEAIYDYSRSCDVNYAQIMEYIDKIPSVTLQPKTGHWIFDEILDKHYYCSECKSMGVDYWDYCPYCGAKMVEPQESEG